MAMASFDPYATLQVAPDADNDVITAAYRALARRYHPDVAGDAGTTEMARLNAAWELIGTPDARTAHDRERRAHLQPVGPGHPTRDRSPGQPDQSASTSWSSPESDGTGAAGRPPGRPSGTVLPFGRHIGWSLGEIARVDPGYLEWLEERPQGRPYATEIDALLCRIGRREAPPEPVGGPASRFRVR